MTIHDLHLCLLPFVPLLLAATAACLDAAVAQTAAKPSIAAKPSVGEQLQPFVDNHTLAGAVTLVASRDRVLDLEAVGYADIAAKKPMTTDAVFWIASQSKPMTATALMMLVDEGKVNVEDPVDKYLPEFKDHWLAVERDNDHLLLKRPLHPITIRNLLTHTSGLPFSSPLEQPTLDLLPLRDRVRSYAMMPLQFQPDTHYQYSNAGINTIGRIIEVVSGMSYEDFMKSHLFQPIGMKDTTFWPNKEQLQRLAHSYKPDAANTGLEETTITQLKYPLDDRTREPMPAGGLFSTANDVSRFCQMILNGGVYHGKRYLTQASVQQMTSKQTGDAIQEGYGFGWSTGGGTFGHGGAYSTNMTIDPHRGLIILFLVQHAGFPDSAGDKINGAFQEAVGSFPNEP